MYGMRPAERSEIAKTKSVLKFSKPKQIKEKAEEKAPKRIDIGKIMDLKRARWTDEDIAAEMRMELAAVSKIIRQYIRRHLVEGVL